MSGSSARSDRAAVGRAVERGARGRPGDAACGAGPQAAGQPTAAREPRHPASQPAASAPPRVGSRRAPRPAAAAEAPEAVAVTEAPAAAPAKAPAKRTRTKAAPAEAPDGRSGGGRGPGQRHPPRHPPARRTKAAPAEAPAVRKAQPAPAKAPARSRTKAVTGRGPGGGTRRGARQRHPSRHVVGRPSRPRPRRVRAEALSRSAASGGLLTRGHPLALTAVRRAIERGRAPHAILLVGPRAVGKTTLAMDLAAGLLCGARGSGRAALPRLPCVSQGRARQPPGPASPGSPRAPASRSASARSRRSSRTCRCCPWRVASGWPSSRPPIGSTRTPRTRCSRRSRSRPVPPASCSAPMTRRPSCRPSPAARARFRLGPVPVADVAALAASTGASRTRRVPRARRGIGRPAGYRGRTRTIARRAAHPRPPGPPAGGPAGRGPADAPRLGGVADGRRRRAGRRAQRRDSPADGADGPRTRPLPPPKRRAAAAASPGFGQQGRPSGRSQPSVAVPRDGS